MSQVIFNSIVPSSTSGNQLATILNDFKNALMTGCSGTTRPSELQEGGTWVDSTDVGSNLLYFKFYDGTQDILIFTINMSTGQVVSAGNEGLLRAFKNSDDTVGPELQLFKRRASGTGQTQSGDVLGFHTFRGRTSTSSEVSVAKIEAKANQNITATQQGSYLAFHTITLNASSLTEIMRLVDAKVGIGTTSPAEALHVVGKIDAQKSSDDTVGAEIHLHKKRATGVGQVLSGDTVGTYSFYSNDDSGNKIEVAQIVVAATENHTATNQGVSLKFRYKLTGSASFSDFYANAKNNVAATAPTANDDSGDGYGVGSFWYDSVANTLYICEDATLTAAVWEVAGGGGRFELYATESISSGGTISSATNKGFQLRRVQGNAGAQTASTTPFGSGGGWYDGTVIRLIGKHDTNTLTIVHNDAAKGAILNGDATLLSGYVLELQYLNTEDRWYEISRNF